MSKKVLKKFRSTNIIYEDFSMDLQPIAQTGESSQQDVVEAGGGKMFLTKGTKKRTRVVHLSVDSKEKDPVGKLFQQLSDVVEQGRAAGQDLPTYQSPKKPVGKVLEETTDHTVAVNEAGGKVEISLCIDLRNHVDFVEKFHQEYFDIHRCLRYNEDSLRKLCRQLAKATTN